ncbi:MAG: hypothetical protein ACOC1K_03210 [Nanoarchaeota archaeon]
MGKNLKDWEDLGYIEKSAVVICFSIALYFTFLSFQPKPEPTSDDWDMDKLDRAEVVASTFLKLEAENPKSIKVNDYPTSYPTAKKEYYVELLGEYKNHDGSWTYNTWKVKVKFEGEDIDDIDDWKLIYIKGW